MTDDPAYIRNLKAVSRSEPSIGDIDAIEEELYASPSDRAMVIASSSFIEITLEQLLASKMRQDLNSKDQKRLFEYDGAVGTFSSKIIVAYALSFIGPITRADLDLIRLLRNEFAHSRKPFGFNTVEVCAVCSKFQIPDFPESVPPARLNRYMKPRDPQPGLGECANISGNIARNRFIISCHNISYRLSVARWGYREGDFVFKDDNPVP